MVVNIDFDGAYRSLATYDDVLPKTVYLLNLLRQLVRVQSSQRQQLPNLEYA